MSAPWFQASCWWQKLLGQFDTSRSSPLSTLKLYCAEKLRASGGEGKTVEQLMLEVGPQAKALVPDAIKAEMLSNLRAASTSPLQSQMQHDGALADRGGQSSSVQN